MTRRRRGDPVHGWVVIDKDEGPTSAAAVHRIRGLLGARKAGHAGTLDPLASGVLPVAFGEATKVVPCLVNCSKSYRFTARFGVGRDTDDAEGRIVATSDMRPSEEVIRSALPEFCGTILQRPPLYSAINIDGRRSYARARAGESVELPERQVHVYRFELVDRPDDDHAIFELVCGRGTYVRSLVRDLATRLETCAHVSQLRRTAVGPFREKDAIRLEKITATVYNERRREYLLPIVAALDDIPALVLTEAETVRVRNGNAIPASQDCSDEGGIGNRAERHEAAFLCVGPGNVPVALARRVEREIRPFRVFNL